MRNILMIKVVYWQAGKSKCYNYYRTEEVYSFSILIIQGLLRFSKNIFDTYPQEEEEQTTIMAMALECKYTIIEIKFPLLILRHYDFPYWLENIFLFCFLYMFLCGLAETTILLKAR